MNLTSVSNNIKLFLEKKLQNFKHSFYVLALLFFSFKPHAQVNHNQTVSFEPSNSDGYYCSADIIINLTATPDGIMVQSNISRQHIRAIRHRGQLYDRNQVPNDVVDELEKKLPHQGLEFLFDINTSTNTLTHSNLANRQIPWWQFLGENQHTSSNSILQKKGYSLYQSGRISISNVRIISAEVKNKQILDRYLQEPEMMVSSRAPERATSSSSNPIPETTIEIVQSSPPEKSISKNAGNQPITDKSESSNQNNVNESVKVKEKHPMGQLVYSIPDSMHVNKLYQVFVRIAKNTLQEDIYSGLTKISADTIIKVSDVMQVDLVDASGDVFRIVPSNEKQLVEDDEYTEWLFDVTPLQSGKGILRVVVSIIKDGNLKQRVYNRQVVVTTSTNVVVKSFFERYWQWVFTTLIVPFFLWFRKSAKNIKLKFK